ncbi:energy transducer TonB [Buttiauxella noackiae]|uniref:energy transducer TonB n=1 Tax=Buttiauxella noackiae TaxID=82992 RepID=UPI0028D08B36|nr:energy transducer TonB [Buttiauxella noackiae]
MISARSLFLLVLIAHILGIAAIGRISSSNKQGTAGMPGVLQVSTIEAGRPAPVTKDITPVVKPAKRVKPAHTRPHKAPRVLAVAAKSSKAIVNRQVQQLVTDKNQPVQPAATNQVVGETNDALAHAGTRQPPSLDADYLSNPAPKYPTLSRMFHEQGLVKLRIHVTAQGKPDAVQLEHSCGYDRLDQAAMAAVWSWRFVPAKESGYAVAGDVTVPVRFSLRS